MSTFEFVSCSTAEHEFLGLCVQSVVIQDRSKRLLDHKQCESALSQLVSVDKVNELFVTLEVLVNDDISGLQALVIVSKRFNWLVLKKLEQKLGVGRVRFIKDSQQPNTLSVLCYWDNGDVFELVRWLIKAQTSDTHQQRSVVSRFASEICNLFENSRHLVEAMNELGSRGIETLRVECDTATDNTRVRQICETICYTISYLMNHLSWYKYPQAYGTLDEKRSKLSITAKHLIEYILANVPITLKFCLNPPLSEREIFHFHFDGKSNSETALFNFRSMYETVFLPSFTIWQQLHNAWHCLNPDTNLSVSLINRYLKENSHNGPCDRCSWCCINEDIDHYLDNLMNKVKEDNNLFEVKKIIKYGSSADETGILRPNEFDRGVILKHFGQVKNGNSERHVIYTGKDPAHSSLKQDGYQLNSSGLLAKFMLAVYDAIARVHDVHVFSPKLINGNTCVTLHFMYHCRCLTLAMKASVDLTIIVETEDKFVPDTSRDIEDCWFLNLVHAHTAYLVPNRTGVGQQWQLSYPTLEREMLLQAGDVVRRVHKLLKLLVVLQGTKSAQEHEIPRKSCLSTYALKTCLFRYMMSRHQWPPWQEQHIWEHALGVLKQFLSSQCDMESFFSKDIVVFKVTNESKTTATRIKDMLAKITNEQKLLKTEGIGEASHKKVADYLSARELYFTIKR